MNIGLVLLVRDLRKLERAYDKLAKGIPDPPLAELTADRALDRVINLLGDAELAARMDALIIDARNAFEANAERNTEEDKRRRTVSLEAEVLRGYGLGLDDIVELYAVFQEVKHEKGKFVSNTQELCECLRS